MKKVLCIGSVTTDVIIKPVDKLPEPGALQYIDSSNMFVGGCASNASIDLAKLGVPVSLVCKLGKDLFGNFVYETAKGYGVDCSGVVFDEGVQTTTSIVCVGSSGERSFLYNCGSTSALTVDEISDEVLADCDIVFIAGALLNHKLDGEPAAKLFKKAQEMGKFTVMDTAFDPTGRWMSGIAAALPYLDLFMPSIEEAQKIAGKDSFEDIAKVFFDMGVKNVIIKAGKKGAYIHEAGKTEGYFAPTYLSVKPTDTTGAGDSFCAGFLAGLAQDFSFDKSAKLGNAVGTHCVMEIGASTGIKPLAEIYKFMEEHTDEVPLDD
ncbi:MAG: carbohydrate kinase family protein [Acutalibacteraceae bacterium]